MKVNFLDDKCVMHTSSEEFGLCDGLDGQMAFPDFDRGDHWIGIVSNERLVNIDFRAVDHCIAVLRDDGNMERCCDCLLTYPDNIVFVELKNKGKDWKETGIKQLETTISNFAANHDLKAIRHKRAFVANRRHPNFHILESEEKRRFFHRYRVRLNVQAKIQI